MADKLHRSGDYVSFHCPGCECGHRIPIAGPGRNWQWNMSMIVPTFKPSILVTSGHYIQGHAGKECWCTYNAAHPDAPSGFKCACCHSYVTDGKIQFLGDSTHKLAGKTVKLPDWDHD